MFLFIFYMDNLFIHMHKFMHARTYDSVLCVKEASPSLTSELRIIFYLHIVFR
jgi:hypothetical protein